jgi:hypothetical protein
MFDCFAVAYNASPDFYQGGLMSRAATGLRSRTYNEGYTREDHVVNILSLLLRNVYGTILTSAGLSGYNTYKTLGQCSRQTAPQTIYPRTIHNNVSSPQHHQGLVPLKSIDIVRSC